MDYLLISKKNCQIFSLLKKTRRQSRCVRKQKNRRLQETMMPEIYFEHLYLYYQGLACALKG